MYELINASAGSAAVEAGLRRIVDTGKALLSADIVLMENGERREIMPGIPSFRAWTTKAQLLGESWTDYRLRTFQEGFDGLDVLRQFEAQIQNLRANDSSGIFLQINFGEQTDPFLLVPQNKMDVARAEAAAAAGFPAIEPILFELLEWIQDLNWPVAKVIEPLLASVGLPLVPHLRRILAMDDDIWKYNVISCLLEGNVPLVEELRPELERISTTPTEEEKQEEVDEAARSALATIS